ncbi:MAG: ribonuclease III [Clostridia bacterium]|nr:ribonuclease III [Clostridia bacterium]
MMNQEILTFEQARMLSPLQLAYIGDAVHALIVRRHLLSRNMPVKKMHQLSVRAVCAVSQNKAAEAVLPLLSDEELSIFRRGRNAHPHHGGPKGATTSEYANATGLEALIGFLYITGNSSRLTELTPYLLPED